MGLMSVLDWIKGKRETTGDAGGGDNVTAEHFAPCGDDSPPMAGDTAACVAGSSTGTAAAVAYRNDLESKSAPGDKRIYARDSSGAEVAEVWIKGTGEIVVANAAAEVVVEVGGRITAHGAEITPAGDFVTALGISLNGHIHNDSTGAPTTAPIPAP
ncbi:MAG: hypothetical protein GY767_22640 [Shimia sp.]|nr:hypothetical protein [Shimia sp.]